MEPGASVRGGTRSGATAPGRESPMRVKLSCRILWPPATAAERRERRRRRLRLVVLVVVGMTVTTLVLAGYTVAAAVSAIMAVVAAATAVSVYLGGHRRRVAS